LLWLAVATESRLAKRNDDVEPDAVEEEVLEADAPAAQADDEDIDVEAPMKSADVPQGQEADAPAAQANDEDIDVEAPMKSADVRQGQEWSHVTCCKKDDPKCLKYEGTKSTTSSGKKCQAWNQQSPHSHKVTSSNAPALRSTGDFETNYCRNPNKSGQSNGAWCYTMDKNIRWESCGIPTCSQGLDLQIIVDSSGSVKEENFKTMMQKISNSIIENLDIGPEKTRVALFKYSSKRIMRNEFNLNKYSTKKAVQEKIVSTVFESGTTYTAEAMWFALKDFKLHQRKNGDGAKRVCLIFTDGEADDKKYVPQASKLWAEDEVSVFAIGIGNNIRHSLLAKTAGAEQRVYQVDNFEEIANIAKGLLDQVWNTITPPTTPPISAPTAAPTAPTAQTAQTASTAGPTAPWTPSNPGTSAPVFTVRTDPQTKDVAAGETVTIRCSASSPLRARPTLTWSKKDGERLQANARDDGRGTLVIYGILERDAGKYECSAQGGFFPQKAYTVITVRTASSAQSPVTTTTTTTSAPGIPLSIVAGDRLEICMGNKPNSDPGCRQSQNRAWGAGYAGEVIFRSSACYNSSYTASTAVGNVGYYCSQKFKSAPCPNVHWWMEFKKGPVALASISFEEGAGKEGGSYQFWGCSGTKDGHCICGTRQTFMEGTAKRLSCNPTGNRNTPEMCATSNGKRFNIFGISSKNCVEYGTGDYYYWSIKNFKFIAH